MKVIIVEDNISVAWEFEMILEKLDIKEILVFKTASKALVELKKNRADLCIVDIYLNKEESGFDFVEKIKKYDIPFIICTGYPKEKYMDRAFELGASGFFSKPIDKPAFSFFVRNFLRKLKFKVDESQYVIFKDGKTIKKFHQYNILYAQIDGNYSTIQTVDRGRFVFKISLKSLGAILSEKYFVRCHRSAAVHLSHISQLDFENDEVVLSSGHKLPIGQRYKNALKLRFMRKE